MTLTEAKLEALKVMANPSGSIPHDVYDAVWTLIDAIQDHTKQEHTLTNADHDVKALVREARRTETADVLQLADALEAEHVTRLSAEKDYETMYEQAADLAQRAERMAEVVEAARLVIAKNAYPDHLAAALARLDEGEA